MNLDFKIGRRKAKQTPLALDVLSGAAAGALGTYLMGSAMQAAQKLQPEHHQEAEQDASWDENATIKTAKRVTEPLGVKIPEEKQGLAGNIVHWAYGISWGIGLALASRFLFKRRPWARGLVFGSALWLVGDELLVPALKLAPKAGAFPPSTHAKGLVAHLAYGLTADGVLRGARKTWAQAMA